MRRVVVTGIGVVSPLGNDPETLFTALAEGRSGVQAMPDWSRYIGLQSRVAAPVHGIEERSIPRKFRRTMGRLAILGALAAEQAVRSAGFESGDAAVHAGACVVGSTMGSGAALESAFDTMLPERDLTLLSGMQFFKCISHTAAMNIAQYLGIGGSVLAPSAACASGLQALGVAVDLIRSGRHDVALAGGAEEVHPTVTGSFDVLFATSAGFNDDPTGTPRPFDARRDGLVCGEGAGIFVLESLEHARARGAPVIAEILGHATCGSASHVSQSDSSSVLRCMRGALRDAGIGPDAVDYVNAHATGTLQGDVEEASAVHELFGDSVPTSSLKGHIAHTLGASGPIELAASLAAARHDVVLPTRGLEQVDPACAGPLHVQELLERPTRVILKNSFAFGGINAALVARVGEAT